MVGDAVGVAVEGTAVGMKVGNAEGLAVVGLCVGLRRVGESVGTAVVSTNDPK